MMNSMNKISRQGNKTTQPAKKKKKVKPMPEWDSTVTDLTQYRATATEMERRKLVHHSKNTEIAKVELMKKPLPEKFKPYFTPSALNALPADFSKFLSPSSTDCYRRAEQDQLQSGWKSSTPDRSHLVLQEILEMVSETGGDGSPTLGKSPPNPQNQSATVQLTSFTSKLLSAVEKLTKLHVTMRAELTKEQELRAAMEQDMDDQRELCQTMVAELIRLNEQHKLMSNLLSGEATPGPTATNNIYLPHPPTTSRIEEQVDSDFGNEPEDPLVEWINNVRLSNKENQPSKLPGNTIPLANKTPSNLLPHSSNISLANRTSSPISHYEQQEREESLVGSWFQSLRQNQPQNEQLISTGHHKMTVDSVHKNASYFSQANSCRSRGEYYPVKEFSAMQSPVWHPMRALHNVSQENFSDSQPSLVSRAILLSPPRQQHSQRSEFWT